MYVEVILIICYICWDFVNLIMKIKNVLTNALATNKCYEINIRNTYVYTKYTMIKEK